MADVLAGQQLITQKYNDFSGGLRFASTFEFEHLTDIIASLALPDDLRALSSAALLKRRVVNCSHA